MKLIIADDLKQRYAENKLRLLLDCATYLDARFKNSFVMESDEVKQKLLTEITNVSPVADLVGDSVVDQSDGIPPNKRVKTGGLAGVLERIRSEKKDGRMSATTQNVNSNQNTAVRVSNVSLLEDELVRYDALAEAEVDVHGSTDLVESECWLLQMPFDSSQKIPLCRCHQCSIRACFQHVWKYC